MTAEQAVAEVRETASHHPDMLKLWVDDVYGKFTKMQPAVFQAAIAEAHKQGVRVAAHVFYLADAKALAAAGVDAFAHSIRDQPVDAELISAMKSRGIFYVPTFTVDESAFIFAEDPSRAIVGTRTTASCSDSSQRTPASPRLSPSAMMCACVTGTKSLAPKNSPTFN